MDNFWVCDSPGSDCGDFGLLACEFLGLPSDIQMDNFWVCDSPESDCGDSGLLASVAL
jgi:hypothetical protein